MALAGLRPLGHVFAQLKIAKRGKGWVSHRQKKEHETYRTVATVDRELVLKNFETLFLVTVSAIGNPTIGLKGATSAYGGSLAGRADTHLASGRLGRGIHLGCRTR